MTEYSESQLTVNWSGLRTDVVDVSDWINGQSLWQVSLYRVTRLQYDYHKRAEIVHAIIHNRSLNHLRRIVRSGWDVNETLRMPKHLVCDRDVPLHVSYEQRTALGEAARTGWTVGVKILLDAGAKSMAPDPSQSPLTLALQNPRYPAYIVELLIKHGGADPNYHDGDSNHIPLLEAITKCTSKRVVKHVQLLLEHGADPNVIEKHFNSCPLSVALKRSALFSMLINFGANINKAWPCIHLHLIYGCMWEDMADLCVVFAKEHLDLVFVHEGNINMENDKDRTLLEHAVEQHANTNNIRWLIRHGADTSMIPLSLTLNFGCNRQYFTDTPLFLLQTGIRVSHGVVRQLKYIEIEPSQEYEPAFSICKAIADRCAQIEKDENTQSRRKQHHSRKTTFNEYLTHQMTDLQEFSDENLNIYPEAKYIQCPYRREWRKNYLDMIHTLVEYLSQPESLQWSCRRCLRENLVSLQPSVVKRLPIPARLKCYILCHEV